MTVFLCDFDDSFTFNIYSELSNIAPSLKIEIISKQNILKTLIELQGSMTKCAVVLGPGPGHPSEHLNLHNTIKKISLNENIFLVGICLGHQIIWEAKNLAVSKCKTPIHGQTRKYLLSKTLATEIGTTRNICVQHYNSLSVKCDKPLEKKLNHEGWHTFTSNNELLISFNRHILTYQFHPESIGTTCPKSFFTALINFLL